jgi:tetratricopeptide (TPR) repeat protein
MTPEEARQLIGLEGKFTNEELEAAFRRRFEELEAKIQRAPTPGLKEKYGRTQAQLEEAWEVLLGTENSSETLNFPTTQPVVSQAKATPASPTPIVTARTTKAPAPRARPVIAFPRWIWAVAVAPPLLIGGVVLLWHQASAPGASFSLAPNSSSSGQQIDTPPPVSAGNETTADCIKSGIAKTEKGDLDGAIADFSEAIQLKPEFAAYYDRGRAKYSKGDYDGAIADFSEAIQLKPDYDAYCDRGFAKDRKGDHDGAIADFSEAIQLKPDYAEVYSYRGAAKESKSDRDGAIADYGKAIQLKPDFAAAYNGLAWQLATCPEAYLRNGSKAVEYATKACELTAWKDFDDLDTLSAACAEAGDFDSAIKWETQCLESPNPSAQLTSSDPKKRLALYQAHQPYHADK